MEQLITFILMLITFAMVSIPTYIILRLTMPVKHRDTDYNNRVWQYITARRWGFIDRGLMIYVKSYILDSPLIYYRNRAGSRPKPFVIYKNLDANRLGLGEEEPVEIGTGYSQLSPVMRGRYLNWLQNGRRDKAVNIALVFIYLYGLEYRAIVEKKSLLNIVYELRGLYSVYKDNETFRSYVEGFMSYLLLKLPSLPIEIDRKRVKEFIEQELPADSALYRTGAYLKVEKLPISKEVLYKIAGEKSREPDNTLPVKFLPIFKDYFDFKAAYYYEEIRFSIKLLEKEEKFYYTPALAQSYFPEAVEVEEVEIGVPGEVLKKLISIRESCLKSLAQYREKIDVGTELELFNLLPAYLAKKHPPSFAYKMEENTHDIEYFAGDLAMALDEKTMSYPEEGSVALCSAFEKMGYAVEPDMRYSKRGFYKYEQITIYPEDEAVDFANSSYKMAAMLYDVGCTLLEYSIYRHNPARESFLDYISDKFCKTEQDKKRLHKRDSLNIYLNEREEIEQLKREEMEKLVSLMLLLALYDGQINSYKVQMVIHILNSLKIPHDMLYTRLKSYRIQNTKQLYSSNLNDLQSFIKENRGVEELLNRLFSSNERWLYDENNDHFADTANSTASDSKDDKVLEKIMELAERLSNSECDYGFYYSTKYDEDD